ncbi:helix-turn-helix domain-containing protein [bacterium]|nr:helix-turn-helix domain-containing protein [bacterium]
MQEKLLTIREVARLLQISPRSIYNRCRKKAPDPFPIRVRRVGKLIRFDPKDIEEYIDRL